MSEKRKSNQIQNKTVESRVELIKQKWELTPDCLETMLKIKILTSNTAKELALLIQELPHDIDRLIAAIDHMELVKDISIHSILLPYHNKE